MSILKDKLKKLDKQGLALYLSMQDECRLLTDSKNKKCLTELIKETGIVNFSSSYQQWYSLAKEVVRQVLPNRLNDFISYYEPGLKRDESKFSLSDYVISDYLLGIRVTRGFETKISPKNAIPKFAQQMLIVKSALDLFDNKLKDLRGVVQADLFDSDLDAAKHLASKKFLRAAGAVAGVILEKHLEQVCKNHNIKINKKNPTISNLNDLLKDDPSNGFLEVSEWRRISRLADLRNKCDHNKKVEPTEQDIDDLIDGVSRTIKELF